MTDLGIAGVGEATLIASGGSALVYSVVGGDGERLAVKVLRGIRGLEVARRFEREQSAAERLRAHPNIIRLHHSGINAAGEPYLVMPLMTGSLQDELERSGPFPVPQAIVDVATAADAIDYAHRNGVLHRDVKPANVLRADDGSVVVTDFGIARVLDAGITSATVGASTPLYAAPELLAENEASVSSDVYALGALLYALLAGAPAFSDSENIWATMHRIRTEDVATIPGIPAELMGVIRAAMAKEPADRPPTAAQFAAQVRSASRFDPEPSLGFETTTSRAPQVWPGRSTTAEIPVVPVFDRPAPVVGAGPADTQARTKVLVSIVVLAVLTGLVGWGAFRLIRGADETSAPDPAVDTSLPSPTQPPGVDSTDSDSTDSDSTDSEVTDSTDGEVTDGAGDPPPGDQAPTRLVSFAGAHFSALLPEGWSVQSQDVDQGYGFRSSFVNGDTYLHIDTTPREQRDANATDIAQSAREIASGINSASQVRTDDLDGLILYSFTFVNRQGVESIDIFFEVDGDGYAIVAGSAGDPDGAFATARLVAQSIRSNPDQ